MHKHLSFIVFCVSLISIAAILRFTNLNWDRNNRIHPDEPVIINGALKIRFFSNMNPGFHDYNGLSVYILRLAASSVSDITKDASYLKTPEGMTIVGRYISAIASTLTVLFIFLLTKQFFPMMIALSSAIIAAFSPIGIQLAHFYTTDSLLVLFLISLILAMTSYLQKPSVQTLGAMTVMLAFSVATKNTGYFFAPLPLLAIGLTHEAWRRKVTHTLLLTGGTLIVFFLCSPYSFLDLSGYIERSKYLQQVVAGTRVFDWSMQFQNTSPIYWFTQNIWAFGPLAILGSVGMVFLIGNWLKHRQKKELPLVLLSLWTIGFSIVLSFSYLKFIRYNAPLVIGFIVGFSYLFHKYHHKTPIKIFFFPIVAIQIIYGFMFLTIYLSPHTSLLATTWIKNTVPNDATILREDWNSIIRYEKEPLADKNLHIDSINLYTLPDADILDPLIKKLVTNDYVVLETPKVRNTILRLSDLYPYTSSFYRLLENGTLGFRKIAEFTSYPRIGPVILKDETAEETFIVFDHPSIYIYKNQHHLTEKELHTILTTK